MKFLKQILRKIFKDNDLLTLFDEIIDSTHTETNVPIGNYLSQWFGNIYLNELDRFLISQGFSKFIRYCDDFLIFSNDKSELLNLRPKIIEFLDTYLKLKLSKAQVNNCKSQGVTFLGYRHISEPTSRILMKRDTLKRIKTRLKSINKSDINKDIDHYRSQIASAIGWIKHTNYFNLYRDLNLSELAVKVGLFQYDLRVNLMHSFKDIADPKDVLGEKISIKDILNKKIILYDYQTYHKKTEKEERDFVKIIYKEKEDDNYRISFTSSKILRNLLDKYQQSLPFTCKIVKVNNTYRLD